jgi:hypothetical protein
VVGHFFAFLHGLWYIPGMKRDPDIKVLNQVGRLGQRLEVAGRKISAAGCSIFLWGFVSLIIFGIIIFLAGCATMPYYATPNTRATYIAENPDTPDHIKEKIMAGQVETGMTKEQVKASWGRPGYVHKLTTASADAEQWEYYGKHFLNFQNGILVSLFQSGR